MGRMSGGVLGEAHQDTTVGEANRQAFSGTSDKIHMRLDVRSTAILLNYELAAAEGVGLVSPKQ